MVVVISCRDIQARLAGTYSVVLRLLNIFTQRLKIVSNSLLNT